MVVVFDKVGMGNGRNGSFSVKEGGFCNDGGKFAGGGSQGEIRIGNNFNKFFFWDRERVCRGHVIGG